MARYLLTVRDADAGLLESWLGGRLEVTRSYGHLDDLPPGRVVVAGLDAMTDEEYEFISARLSTSGPLYHAGGPGMRRVRVLHDRRCDRDLCHPDCQVRRKRQEDM